MNDDREGRPPYVINEDYIVTIVKKLVLQDKRIIVKLLSSENWNQSEIN